MAIFNETSDRKRDFRQFWSFWQQIQQQIQSGQLLYKATALYE